MTSVHVLAEAHAEPELAPGVEPEARTQWQLFRRRFFRHRLAMVGLTMLVLLFAACFCARWIAPYPRNHIDLLVQGQTPSRHHLLGTDTAGRDYLTEILYAGQLSLKIGLVVAVLSTALGVAIGSVAGYFGQAVDQGLMRLTDLFLIVPQIAVVAIAVKKWGGSDLTIIVALAVVFWMTIARIVRSQVLSLKEREFVDAARVAGASSRRIIVRHLLPNMVGPVAVNATLAMAAAIVTESTLSFLGYGVQPPRTSWGNMLSTSEEFFGTTKAFLIYFPGLAILLTVLAINFVGDGLRDAFDPSARR
jgi:peptide/nickel transport system permease protein